MLDLKTCPEQDIELFIPKIEYVGIATDDTRNDFDNFFDLGQYPTTSSIQIIPDFYIPERSKNDVIKEIISFKSLINNWDGYSAIPLEVQSAANAISVINGLSEEACNSIVNIQPNPHGTISMLWSNGEHEAVSIEIGNYSMSYYRDYNNENTEYFDNIEINDQEISRLEESIQKIIY